MIEEELDHDGVGIKFLEVKTRLILMLYSGGFTLFFYYHIIR